MLWTILKLFCLVLRFDLSAIPCNLHFPKIHAVEREPPVVNMYETINVLYYLDRKKYYFPRTTKSTLSDCPIEIQGDDSEWCAAKCRQKCYFLIVP